MPHWSLVVAGSKRRCQSVPHTSWGPAVPQSSWTAHDEYHTMFNKKVNLSSFRLILFLLTRSWIYHKNLTQALLPGDTTGIRSSVCSRSKCIESYSCKPTAQLATSEKKKIYIIHKTLNGSRYKLFTAAIGRSWSFLAQQKHTQH